MASVLEKKEIILGVTGGIAAYKSVELMRLLTAAGAHEELIQEVYTIIEHYRDPGQEASADVKIVHDAFVIVRLEEEQKDNPLNPDKLLTVLEQSLFLDSSRKLAERVLLKPGRN